MTYRKSWPAAFSTLAFLPPFFGLFPRYCEPHDPGGGGAGAPGDAGAPGAAGAPGDAGASSEGGSAGGTPIDRVVEPLLGCVNGVSGKLTPGAFDVLEPHFDFSPSDYPWLTDWSGDGQTAVGVYTNEPFEDAYGAFFVSWHAGTGYQLDSKIRIELSQFNEPPTSLVSCDGSVQVQRSGDGSVWSNSSLAVPRQEGSQFFHDNLTLSEDGSTLTFVSGIRDQTRPWSEWHSSRGDLQTLLLDWVQSVSWDGLTAFGTSSCYTHTCEPPKTFVWRPLGGGADVTTTAPTPIVAADGETIVFDYNTTHIGIWRNETTETIDCVDACHAIAWSARAQVLLVTLQDDFALWTQPHGFRRLSTLLTIPDGWTIVPTDVSLDGWTVHGTASSDAMPFAYFRATLNAGAFQ